MDERDFELLSALEKTRNITRAANLLYVSQSALSKRISAIEQELDIMLMLRSRQGVHFTPEGELVVARTKEAANQLKLLRETLDTRRNYVCGTLNAGISVNYALYQFPAVLADYRRQYPHVNTHITTDHSRKLYDQLLAGTIDIAVIRGEYPWNGQRTLLTCEKICAICNQEDAGKPLNDLSYIGRKTDVAFEREINQWLHENNLHPEPNGIHVDSITTCVEMVTRGVGWSIVPEICLENFNGHMEPLYFLSGEPFVRSTYLMYTDTILSLPQVEAFIKVAKDHCI